MIGNPVVVYILGGCVVSVFTAALTFFIVTVSHNKNLSTELGNSIKTHKEIYHQKSATDLIKIHENECLSRGDYIPVKIALVFLVEKAGGDPNKMGLT